MGVYRRLLFKDYINRANGAGAPQNWTAVDGTWDVLGRRTRLTATPTGRLRNTTARTQNTRLLYNWSVKSSANGLYGLHIFASATTGAGLGNSYLFDVDTTGGANNARLVRYNADVPTTLSTATVTQANNTEYYFLWDYNPSTGVHTIYGPTDMTTVGHPHQPDMATILTYTDASQLSTGDYYAFRATAVTPEFGRFRARYPDLEVTKFEVDHGLDRPSVCVLGIPRITTGAQTDVSMNDEIEGVLSDGTTETLDFDGRVERIEQRQGRGIDTDITHVFCRSYSSSLLQEEGAQPSTNQLLSAHMTDIVNRAIDTVHLSTNNISATVGNTTRDTSGKYVLDQLKDWMLEASYYMFQDGEKQLLITGTWGASGLTIDEADGRIVFIEQVEDTVDLVNRSITYFAGAVRQMDENATSQGSYGLRTKIIADPTIPSAGDATALNNYWLNNTNVSNATPRVLDIWCADYHELQPGQTLTLTIASLGISAVTYSCIAKSYSSDEPLLKFRLVQGNGVNRQMWNTVQKTTQIGGLAQGVLAYERTA